MSRSQKPRSQKSAQSSLVVVCGEEKVIHDSTAAKNLPNGDPIKGGC